MAGNKVATGGNGGKQVNPKTPNPKSSKPPKKRKKKAAPRPKPKNQETMIATGGRGGQRKRKGTG